MALGTMAAIAAGGQALLGMGQAIKGLTMPKPDIPDYDIPQEIYQNMTDAEYWSFIGLPDAQKQLFIDNMAQQGASALSRSSSRKGGLGMVSTIADQQRQANRELLAMDASQRAKNQENLYRARSAMAEQRAVKYGFERDKSMQLRQERKDMIGAGMQNIAGAFGTMGSMASLGAFDDWRSPTTKTNASNAGATSVASTPQPSVSGGGSGMGSVWGEQQQIKSIFGI